MYVGMQVYAGGMCYTSSRRIITGQLASNQSTNAERGRGKRTFQALSHAPRLAMLNATPYRSFRWIFLYCCVCWWETLIGRKTENGGMHPVWDGHAFTASMNYFVLSRIKYRYRGKWCGPGVVPMFREGILEENAQNTIPGIP